MSDGYTFHELCKVLGRGGHYVMSIQKHLGLHIARRGETYPEGYLRLLEKVISLRVFNVGIEQIVELFQREKRILEILNFDALTTSPTWYLDASDSAGDEERTLLLTGFDIGMPLAATGVQVNLDFSGKTRELFAPAQMGEDIVKILQGYREMLAAIKQKIDSETPILQNALAWSRMAFRSGPA